MACRVAVMASGGGTNFENLAVHRDDIGIDIRVLITDRSDAHAIERANRLGILSVVHAREDYASRADHEAAIIRTLVHHDIEYLLLAGYMRILSAGFITNFKRRIINLHPSLLPSFKGRNGIEDAYNYGVQVTGVTVHFVDAGIDTGEIILQSPIIVEKNDTLEDVEQRIHELEYTLYPDAIKKVLKERDDEKSTH